LARIYLDDGHIPAGGAASPLGSHETIGKRSLRAHLEAIAGRWCAGAVDQSSARRLCEIEVKQIVAVPRCHRIRVRDETTVAAARRHVAHECTDRGAGR